MSDEALSVDDLRYIRRTMETHYQNLITPPGSFVRGGTPVAPADSPLHAERKRMHAGLTAFIVVAGGDAGDTDT